MKLLLVDDTKKHRKAGVEQLTAAGHEVVALSSYEDAVRKAHDGEHFDVALLDLLMPAEGMMLGGEGLQFLGQSIDVGFSLAMKLAMEGIKNVAVVTDMNHHSHPASAIMDWFLGKKLDICGSKVRFLHARLTDEGVKDWSAALKELLG
jgi:CheY-like chemotaxis protein